MPGQQFKEWRRLFKSMRRCLELQETRFIVLLCHLCFPTFTFEGLGSFFWHNGKCLWVILTYFLSNSNTLFQNWSINGMRICGRIKICSCLFFYLYFWMVHGGYFHLTIQFSLSWNIYVGSMILFEYFFLWFESCCMPDFCVFLLWFLNALSCLYYLSYIAQHKNISLGRVWMIGR